MSPSRLHPARRTAVLLAGIALLLVLATPASGQQDASLPSGGPWVDLLTGADGWDPGVHLAGGIGAGYMLNRWAGLEGVAMGGGGGGYRSVHLAAGPSLRLLQSPRGELRSWVGAGWYQESLTGLPASPASPAIEPRSMLTLAGGLVGRIPAGPVKLTTGILVWHGSVDADGFEQSTRSTGVRLVVGVGR